MIRTGDEYRDSVRGTRDVYVNGEKVKDVTTHSQFQPLVDIRARIYDMQHETEHQGCDDRRAGWRAQRARKRAALATRRTTGGQSAARPTT